MRNRNCATTFIVYSATLMTLLGCGSSAEDSPAGNGGSIGVGGSATGGKALTTGGKVSTGGALGQTGGSEATGGAVATGGIASTGGVATGGVMATGGAMATGGNKATGGSRATSDAGSNPEVEAMCRDVCALLNNRTPQLTCVPSDCEGTCNTIYVRLSGAKAACSDAYVALYECGLSQPASSWECFTVTAGTVDIDIPVPPRSAATCGTEYQALYSMILTNLNTCGAALSG